MLAPMRVLLVNDRFRTGLLLFLASLLIAGLLPVRAQTGVPASTVNGTIITQTEFEQRVRFLRWQYLQELTTLHTVTGGNFNLTPGYVNARLYDLQHPAELGDIVLTQLEEEALLWQASTTLGIAPTAGDVQVLEDAFFSAWTDVPAEQLARDAEAQEFITSWYGGAAAASGLSHAAIRHIFETEALRNQVYDHVVANVPREEPAVYLRRILCAFHPGDRASTAPPTAEERAAAEECTNRALDQLAFGHPFANVAAAYSDDPTSAAQGGDLGWVLESYLADEYATAIVDAEPGAVIGPIETAYGLHIIQLSERGIQPLTNEQYDAAVQGYFVLWLDTLRTEAAITRTPGWDAAIPTDPGFDTLPEAVRAAVETYLASATP